MRENRAERNEMKEQILKYLHAHPGSTAKEIAKFVFKDASDKSLINVFISNEMKGLVARTEYCYSLTKEGEKLLNANKIIKKKPSTTNRSMSKEVCIKREQHKYDDLPLFARMKRLYEEKISELDIWYENEARAFTINIDEDIISFIEAYGRTIRQSIHKTEVVIEGEEDFDMWGI